MDSQKFKGCLLGLATGDAVGTTLEFKPRGTFPALTDLVGGGPFNLNPGEWTDDTSMALCLAASLLEKNGFDPEDQMKRYCNWRRSGYMSSNGRCFDIGVTVSAALDRYLADGNPLAGSTQPNTAGNGSIMRLAPVAMYYFPDAERVRRYCRESSTTTHGAAECLDACEILGTLLTRAFDSNDKSAVLDEVAISPATNSIRAIAAGEWKQKSAEQISGSGYVVDSLEAALWCFSTTENYADCVLKAANLGDDADTTAAISGQLAGAFYGMASIPERWLGKLHMAGDIEEMAQALHAARVELD